MIKQLGDPDGSVFQTASSGDSSSSTTAAESQRTSPMHNDPGTRDNSHFYQFSNFSSHDSSSLPFKKISSQPCEENKHAGPNLDMAFHVTPQGRVKSAFSPSLRHLHEDPLKKSICTQIEMLWARHRMPHGKAQGLFS